MRAAVAISISLLVTAGVGTAAAQCSKAWVGSSARTMPTTGRPQGLSLGFDGSVQRVEHLARSTFGLDGQVAWSSDGSRFAFTTQRGFLLARSGGATTLIPLGPCAGGFVVGFAKNGRVLVQAFNRTAGR